MTTGVLEKKLKPLREPAKGRLMRYLLSNFPPRPLETKEMHRHYSQAIQVLLEAVERKAVSRADHDCILRFVTLVSPFVADFERKARPMAAADPIEVLEFLMESHGLKQVDLAPELGGQPVVSALLSRKRDLNVDQIARLSARFGVSPATFFPGR